MKKLPVFQSKSSKFFYNILLGGKLVNLYFRWNTRAEYWYLDFEIVNADKITGIKLVENWVLLRQYKALLPNFNGDLIVKCVNCTNPTITYNNLGNGFDLFYITEAEAEEWESYYGIG